MSFINKKVKSEVAYLTINKPSSLNALNQQVIEELSLELDTILKDDQVKVLVITGAGEKAFIAGADIKEFASFDVTQGTDLAAQGQRKLFDKLANYPKPIVAAINGYALGGGLELALACHIRIASPNAKFGLPEVTLGLIPGYGGTQRLPLLIGRGRATQMILSGEMIGADVALDWGLVSEVTEDLEAQATHWAHKMTRLGSTALEAAIKAVNGLYKGNENFQNEIELFGQQFGTEDFRKGVDKFLKK